MGGRRTPSSAPRRGRAGAVTSPVDAANVRKSNRPAKPRSLDLLPSGACHLAPGLAAVGRRLKVHWPDEMQWFAGQVTHFDELSGKHHVVYDDGDSEELFLAAERFEWLQATHTLGVKLAPPLPAAAETFAELQEASPQQRSAGRKDAAPCDADGGWPCVGDFLWGRVKGHGWWPGRAVYPISEKPSATAVCVEFFDNTSGWVLRNECLPFEEHFDALQRSKRVAAFAKATRLAWNAWAHEHSPHSDMKRRPGAGFTGRLPSAKRARTQETDPAPGGPFAAGGGDMLLGAPMHLDGASRPRRTATRRSGASRRPSKPRAAPPRGFGAAVGVFVVGGKAADVSDLARRLGDLKSRLSPIAAQAHERVAAQLRTLLQPDARRVFSPAPGSWAAQERLRLLSQLEALERLPRLAVAVKRSCAFSAAPPEALQVQSSVAAHDAAPPPPVLDDAAAGEAVPDDAPAGGELGEPLAYQQEEAIDGNATEESDG